MRRSVHWAFLLTAALCLLAAPIASGASADLVVSQVYAGGGNSGATYVDDFVELFNRGSGAVDLTGWSLQYATATGTSWQVTALAGSLAPGRHYLVALASGGAAGAPLPAVDETGTSNLATAGGKVALVHDTAALTCGANVRELRRGRDRARPRRLRIGDRLRGRRRACALEHDRRHSRRERLQRHGRERLRLHRRCSLASYHGVCRDDLQRHGPDGLGLGRGPSRPRPAVVTLDCAREADVELRQCLPGRIAHRAHRPGHGHEHERGRLLAQRAPERIHARRPPARPGCERTWGWPACVRYSPGTRGSRSPWHRPPTSSVGTTSAPSAGTGDDWSTSLDFTSPLPSLAAGHYSATVTFTVIAR